jgi:hypothetical protein
VGYFLYHYLPYLAPVDVAFRVSGTQQKARPPQRVLSIRPSGLPCSLTSIIFIALFTHAIRIIFLKASLEITHDYQS